MKQNENSHFVQFQLQYVYNIHKKYKTCNSENIMRQIDTLLILQNFQENHFYCLAEILT